MGHRYMFNQQPAVRPVQTLYKYQRLTTLDYNCQQLPDWPAKILVYTPSPWRWHCKIRGCEERVAQTKADPWSLLLLLPRPGSTHPSSFSISDPCPHQEYSKSHLAMQATPTTVTQPLPPGAAPSLGSSLVACFRLGATEAWKAKIVNHMPFHQAPVTPALTHASQGCASLPHLHTAG